MEKFTGGNPWISRIILEDFLFFSILLSRRSGHENDVDDIGYITRGTYGHCLKPITGQDTCGLI